ncbi:hypothetical protein Tco_1080749 [Tanacetum coccineum]|uniref:Uncharacterized protein n=1 Tax=Tanacetum coccineum TaxID=301880 RepID=A0ABQ5HWV2_9ASTR
MGFLGPTSPKPHNPSFSPKSSSEARSLSRTEVGLVGDSSEASLPDSNFRMSILSVGDTAIVLKYFKVHISQLVPLGLTKVITFEVLCRRSLGIRAYRVVDRTTPPAPAGTTIPHASPEEIAVTRPDPNIESKSVWAGSSGLATGDEVEQTDDGTFNDDGQRDGSEFAMEDVGNLNNVGQDKEVEAHTELSRGVRRTTRASSHASHGVIEDVSFPAQEAMTAPGTQPLDTNASADEIASDGNVDSYFDAQVSNSAGDVLERDLLSFISGPYYIPYPYDENNRFEIHRLHELSSVELSDHMSMLQCQLITHGRAFHARYDHSLREVERLAKRCAQQTHIIKKHNADLKQHKESTVYAIKEVFGLKAELGALKSKCEATEHKLSSWDKKHRKYRSERDTLAKEKAKIEEELKSQLEHRERQAEEIQGSITSFFQSDFTPLVRRFLKSSEFNRAFAGVLNTAISVGVERGLRMGRTDEEFRGLSQRVAGFIPDAKEKFDRVIAAFPDTTFPFLDKVSQHSQSSLQDIARLEPDRVTPSSQPSSATASLRTNTHARHSTSSSGTFGHTSTPEHLKKKKKPVERGGPSAA